METVGHRKVRGSSHRSGCWIDIKEGEKNREIRRIRKDDEDDEAQRRSSRFTTLVALTPTDPGRFALNTQCDRIHLVQWN